ncbi:MAG: hypothetical protein KUG77_11460 [Nannocystaceae bacterium]|nr:hypothetical protein [Nannocystaceae bacterium]
MRISMLMSLAATIAVLASCDGGNGGAVGAPCNTADDCQGDLTCDEHNGQASCQQSHGHGETEGGSSSSSGETGHSHDTDKAHDTEHSGTGHADTEHADTESTDTEHADTESADTEHDHTAGGETDATGTGGSSELCEAFCGCMQTACSSYDGYPYADADACMTACEALDEATIGCYGGFCQQASDAEGTLVEHYCEHAWGELGDEKC